MDIDLIELAIPLARSFETAAGRLDERRVVLVGVHDGDVVGWGEAAPYPGMTPDTTDGVWNSITGELALTPTAAAALEQAEADLGARVDGVPLWSALGGSWRPLPESLAIGLDEDPIERIAAIAPQAVKLKIRPGAELMRVETVRDRYPELAIGVDANGSYAWEGRDALIDLDRFDVSYVEQPFAPSDFASHAALRQEMFADVVLDEPIDGVNAAVEAIEAGAADVIAAAPGRIGPEACRVIHDLAMTAGLRIKVSGLLETGVGRAHATAVAMLPATAHSDLGDETWFFPNPTVLAIDGPGIGVEPDFDALEPFVVRRAAVTRPAARDRG